QSLPLNHQCRYCTKKFYEKYHLTKHEKTHESSSEDLTVSKKFYEKYHLTKHEKTHESSSEDLTVSKKFYEKCGKWSGLEDYS
ncbi:hypothetical protein T484DRAFT_1790525, partial [Baffinella frigidus]